MHAANLGIDVVICIGELAKNIADAQRKIIKILKCFILKQKKNLKTKWMTY